VPDLGAVHQVELLGEGQAVDVAGERLGLEAGLAGAARELREVEQVFAEAVDVKRVEPLRLAELVRDATRRRFLAAQVSRGLLPLPPSVVAKVPAIHLPHPPRWTSLPTPGCPGVKMG
jgi:hypothetical protein